MSRIARLNGAGIPQDPFPARTKLSYRPKQSPPDEPNSTLPTLEPPKSQRRSLKDTQKPLAAIPHARSAIARTSTSSTDEMSETESHSRISSSSKTSTSRSSLSRSPTIPREQSPTDHLVLNERVAVPTMSVIGTLRFVGQTKFKPGIWTGIELDLVGSGKNDGCVQGVRYFTCPPQTGLFIIATKVIPLVEERTETMRPPIKKVSAIPSNRLQTMIKPSASKSTRISRTPLPPTPTATKSTANLRTSASKGTSGSINGVSAARMPLPERPTASRTPRKPTVARIPITGDRSLDTSVPSVPSTPKRHSFPVQTDIEPRLPIDLVLASLGPETNIDFRQGSPTVDCPKTRMELDEQKRILELLEKTERENRQLNEQMRAKEIAWERLVSSKESFALMVEEKEGELGRLRTALMEAQDQHRSLQGVLVDKEETLAKNNRDDVNEEQYQRRIEKLERLVLELQTQATKQAKLHESQVRDHAGQIEKIRREVVESENMIVTLEGECEELRRAGLETLNACQNTVHQIEDQKVALGAEKDKQIEHLNRVIEDLRRRQSVLFGDDDMDYRDDEGDAEWEDQRRRMEEQLELATTELENERLQVKHGKSELDKLRQQMAQQQITSASSDERVANLKRELEKEVDDKRRLIEEADAAFEAQARAEDENYEMKLSRVRMENELTEAHRTIEALQSTVGASEPKLGTQTDELQRALETSRQAEERLQKECERLQEISKQSEQECMRLMDELLQLEKGGSEDEEYKNSFKDTSAQKKLEKELADTQHRYTALELSKRTEISQLSKELADLEALVESKVFGEGDLEESLELERKRVADLEKQLAAYRSSTRNLTSPVSPITRTSQSLGIDKDDKDDIYCELCEEAGHDIIDCHAYISEISDKTDSDQLRMYCDNCDEHGFHKTEDCPNQDETF